MSMIQSIDDFLKSNSPSNSPNHLQTIDDFLKPQTESDKQGVTFNPSVLHPENTPIMQAAHQLAMQPEKPAWNGVMDNPITHGVEAGLSWVQKPFEAISTGLADLGSGVDNLTMSHKQMNYDGTEQTLTPHAPVHFLKDLKDIFSQTNEHVSSDAWHNNLVNTRKLPGTNADIADVADFGAQFIGPGKFITPITKGLKLGEAFDNMFTKIKPSEVTPISQAKPVLGLPEPRSAQRLRDAQQSSVLEPNTSPIYGHGDVQTLGLPESQQYNEIQRIKSQQTLGLPEANTQTIADFNRRNGNVLPTNNDPIYGHGDIAEPLGLPQGNYTQPSRLKVNDSNQTLDYVMNKIKPEVIDIIQAPARRDLLVQYVQKNMQMPLDEIHNMPMKDLQDLGQQIQDKLHGNMQQIAYDVAAKHGHDLPALLEGQAPSLRGQMANDAQSRVYGVPAKKVNVTKPQFNKEVSGQAAAPKQGLSFKREPKLSDAKANTETQQQMQQRYERQIKETSDRQRISELSKPLIGRAAMPETKVKLADTKIQPKITKLSEAKPLRASVERPATSVQGALPKDELGFAKTDKGIRGNFKNQLENGNFSSELQQKIKNTDHSYEKVTNEESLNRANENVKNVTAAESRFLGNVEYSPEHVATGYRLMQELDRAGQHERALNIANKLARDLTRSGQTSQAAAILQKLSPEGRLLELTRHAKRNGKAVTVEDSKVYKELAKEAQDAGLSGKRSSEVMDIFDRAKKGEKITEEDTHKLNELIKDVKSYVKAKDGELPKEAKLSPKMKEKGIRDKVLSVLADQEKAVLERMQKRKGRLSSTPFDYYGDLALLGSIKLAKGAISFSKWAEQMIKDVGSDIKPHLAPIYEKAQRLLEDTTNKITDVKANNAEKVAEKFIKEGNISPQDEQMLRNLAKQVNELSGDGGIKADMKMQQILNSYQKSNFGAKVATIRYIDMLLNSGTQAVNAISGPLMMTYNHMLDTMATPLNIVWSKVMGTARTTTFKQGPGLFDGYFDTIKDFFKGGKIGGKSGWQGVDPDGIATQHDIRGLTFKGKYNPIGIAERTLGAVSKAPDYATYYATKMTELRKQAYLDAINKGVKGNQNIRNYMDKYLANPPEKALEQASRIGKKTTFQFTGGIAGKAARAARKVNELTGSKDLGLANAIVPFVRTPTNMAIVGVENTPAGILKGLFEINRLHKGAEDISKREILKTFVSATAGGTAALGGLGYILADLGIVTGDYSSTDKDVQGLQDAVGKGKFRFNTTAFGRMFDALVHGDIDKLKEVSQYKEGDNQFDYNKLQPLAFPFAAGATLSDQRKVASLAKARGEDYPFSKQLGEAGKSAASSLFGMSSLQGLTSTFQTKPGAKGSEIPLQISQNVAESFMKGFSPSFLAQEARRQDPIQRETTYNKSLGEDVGSYFKSRTPGMSQSLPPKQTNLGDTKVNATGITGQYLNPLKSEKTQYSEAAQVIYDLIGRTGNEKLAPTAMDKTVEGKNKLGVRTVIKIPADRYTQLQNDVGSQIATKILALPKYMSDEEKSTKIEDIYTKVRESERNKVKKEFGIRIQ